MGSTCREVFFFETVDDPFRRPKLTGSRGPYHLNFASFQLLWYSERDIFGEGKIKLQFCDIEARERRVQYRPTSSNSN